ncbi:hypothetical protein OpiT1DRAFT_03060 [Opitutaceae bacterium TAV1]|nr:hypothetical protein OpiT1DRAFT_03060 [Opitutaceae bacterium TAV1]
MKTALRLFLLRLLPLLAALLPPLSVRAAADDAPKKEISAAVSAELGKLRTLTEAKDYAGSLRLIDQLLPGTAADSFDRAILSQIKVQILLTVDRYAEAIAPLETALALGERYSFFEKKPLVDQRYLLSQLYYQEGSEAKDPARRADFLRKAYEQIRLWFAGAPQPTFDARIYAASILYSLATLDAEKPDHGLLRQALAEAGESLYLKAAPGDQPYILLLAIHQQLGEAASAAELLELLVSRHPDSAQYWQQLAATYFGLASESKDPKETARYNLRAILTLERARQQGLLDSPKENFSLVALYLTLENYDRAITLLEEGLASGAIENTRRNWELLATACQQANREKQAVETLGRAIGMFPRDAQLEFSLAQLHYSLGQIGEARTRLEAALGKDGLEKPGQARLFLAYIDYELQRFEEAEKWAGEAAAHPDAKPEDVRRLTRAVRDALAARSGKS